MLIAHLSYDMTRALQEKNLMLDYTVHHSSCIGFAEMSVKIGMHQNQKMVAELCLYKKNENF